MSNNDGLFIGRGAKRLYMGHLRPFLLKHQARMDQILEFVYREMSKFVSAHGAELQFAKTLLMKALEFANGLVRDVIRPVQRQADGVIEGPQDSESDKED
ncbi:hypothetical protein L484_026940 [Morus notabilis]|uniref:Uncharacterized protein n=1 Tax=Morus notabilis TaxID=981085 RepID=W9R187_9ROSA|nr:hypothetical protein L484_026940 [Morus notabilis]